MKAMTVGENATIMTVEYFSDKVIDEFIASRHGSANTNRTYRNGLKRLLGYFTVRNVTAPTAADIDAFINDLRGSGKSDSTIRLYVTITKMFFAFLEKCGVYKNVCADVTPLRMKKRQAHKRDALTKEQARNLVSSINGEDVISLRDKAIVALCLTCALRTVEIERANVEDLTDAGGHFELIVQGKGDVVKEDVVKVPCRVAALIKNYVAARGEVKKDALYSKGEESPLFASTSRNHSGGRRLSAQSVGKMIKARLKKIGVDNKKITAHSTRHFAATQAIQNGIDLREVSQMLRHSSLNITSCYIHDISLQNRRAELSVAESLFGCAC